jgi:hypothetical protein
VCHRERRRSCHRKSPLPPPLYSATAGWRDLAPLIDKLLALGADIEAKEPQVPPPPLRHSMRIPSRRALTPLPPHCPTHHQSTHTHTHAVAPPPPPTSPVACLIADRVSIAQEYTPLHLADLNDQTAALERLVEKGADIEAKNNVRGQLPPLPHASLYPADSACTLYAPSVAGGLAPLVTDWRANAGVPTTCILPVGSRLLPPPLLTSTLPLRHRRMARPLST